jgi:hypothetical protein
MRISDLHEHEYRTLNNQKNLSDIEEEIYFLANDVNGERSRSHDWTSKTLLASPVVDSRYFRAAVVRAASLS